MAPRILFVVVAVTTFLLDRVTKILVVEQMTLGEQRPLVGELLSLHYIHNRGVAFGLLSGRTSLVLFGSIIVGLLLFWFMLRVKPEDYWTIVGGGLLLGGAIGNLVDRVGNGYVVDFLRLPNWPMFNIADIGIVSGVVLIMIGQIRAEIRERSGTVAVNDAETQMPPRADNDGANS